MRSGLELEREGWNPVDVSQADMLTVQSNLMPLDALGQIAPSLEETNNTPKPEKN